MLRFIILIAIVISTGVVMIAQESTEEPDDEPITEDAWRIIDLEAETEEEAELGLALYLSIGDDTLIEVARGADLVYTQVDDTTYTGAPLIPTDAYDSEITLSLIDDDTRAVVSTTQTGALTFESTLQLERTDLAYMVWTETERTVIEFSMFQECMGRSGGTPPGAFSVPDLLVPIRIDEEDGVLYIGDQAYPGAGGIFELVEEGEFGQFQRVITSTVTVESEDSILFQYHAIADERDDCEMIYEATLVPFDGDFDRLFEIAAELAAADEAD